MPWRHKSLDVFQKWEFHQDGYLAIYHQQVSLGADASKRPTNPSVEDINAAYLDVIGYPGDCSEDFPKLIGETVPNCYYNEPPDPAPGHGFNFSKWTDLCNMVRKRIEGTMWSIEMCVQLQDCLQFGTGGKGGVFTL